MLSKLELQTAPQAPSQKTCRAPVAKPLTSTLLTSRAAPSSPAPVTKVLLTAHVRMYNTASRMADTCSCWKKRCCRFLELNGVRRVGS